VGVKGGVAVGVRVGVELGVRVGVASSSANLRFYKATESKSQSHFSIFDSFRLKIF